MTLVAFSVLVGVIELIQIVVVAPQGREEIVSDDFTKPRPKPSPKPVKTGLMGKRSGGGPVAGPTPPPVSTRHYNLASPMYSGAAPGGFEQLGITIWRLRPARQIDSGERIVLKEQGRTSDWIPERIQADTPLGTGDRLRLTIEARSEGYLYVIDRDLYSSGALGKPSLIFPTRGVDNKVRAGRLVDIPGQNDVVNYIASGNGRNARAGRVLTVIVTSVPLELSVAGSSPVVSESDVEQWEKDWGAEIERYELEGGAGKTWTTEEKQAASDPERRLTQDEPAPQTIYRIFTANKSRVLVNLRLVYQGLAPITN